MEEGLGPLFYGKIISGIRGEGEGTVDTTLFRDD
jgi:hypothetical protein